MNCSGCVHYVYESDTNFSYCTHREHPSGSVLPEECEDYYSIEDAKADAKYGDKEKY